MHEVEERLDGGMGKMSSPEGMDQEQLDGTDSVVLDVVLMTGMKLKEPAPSFADKGWW